MPASSIALPPSDDLALVREAAALLRTQRFGRAWRGYRSIGSTNTVAAAWAAEGGPEGGVVVAEHQTAGRGRLGRSWQAHPGRNLTFSVILRPALPPSRLSLIPVAAGLAVAEAIDAAAGPLHAVVKWPNDVMLGGRKCCGMLLESTLTGGAATIVLGIGLNVNQESFPEELAGRATSLRLEAGRPIPRPMLLAALLEHLERRYLSLGTNAEAALHAAYIDRLLGLGQPLTLYLAGRSASVSGTFVGVTDTGALRLQTGDGLQTFHAGEVTTHPEVRV